MQIDGLINPWKPDGYGNFYTDGYVGIGNDTPEDALSVVGNIAIARDMVSDPGKMYVSRDTDIHVYESEPVR